MESSFYHEESRNYSSSDQDQVRDEVDLGVGRSYECVFCKRGFNTAQALGGHMNIHRKDRARNKPNSKPDVPTPPRIYFPPAPDSSKSTLYESNRTPLIPGDWRMRLSDNKAIIHQEKELDLELRLGYHS